MEVVEAGFGVCVRVCVGVLSNKCLSFIQLEVGGLGQRACFSPFISQLTRHPRTSDRKMGREGGERERNEQE